jgi:hypothetical protein
MQYYGECATSAAIGSASGVAEMPASAGVALAVGVGGVRIRCKQFIFIGTPQSRNYPQTIDNIKIK